MGKHFSPRIAAAVLLLSFPASPQTPPSRADKVAADTLFDEAKQLIQSGKFAEACPKLEESQKLDPGVGTLLHLASCYEKLGRTASAWTTFREAANAAKNAGQADREQIAVKLATALEPRLSRLTLTVSPRNDPKALVITRNGSPVNRALWGTPLPIDPGPQVIEASAPSMKTWMQRVEISASGSTAIEIPVLEPAPVVAPAPTPSAAPPPASSAAPPPPPPPPTAPPPAVDTSRRTLALVAGGVGVVSLGVGAYLGARTFSLWDQAQQGCPARKCNDNDSYQAADKAHTYGTLSTVFFAVGAVGAGAGAVLWLTAPSSASSTGLSPILSPQLAGLSLRRSW